MYTPLKLALVFLAIFVTHSTFGVATRVLFQASTVVEEDYSGYSKYRWDTYVEDNIKLYWTDLVLREEGNKRVLYFNRFEIDVKEASKKLGTDAEPEQSVLKAHASKKQEKPQFGEVEHDSYSKSRKTYLALANVLGHEYELNVFQRQQVAAELHGEHYWGELENAEVKDSDLWKASKPLRLEFEDALKKSDYVLIKKVKEAFTKGESSVFFEHLIPSELDNLQWRHRLLPTNQRRKVYEHFDGIKDFVEKDLGEEIVEFEKVNEGLFSFVRRPSDSAVVAIVGQFSLVVKNWGECALNVLTPVNKKDWTILEFECE